MGLAMHETPVLSFVDQVFTMLETTSDTWSWNNFKPSTPTPSCTHSTDARAHHGGRAMHALPKPTALG